MNTAQRARAVIESIYNNADDDNACEGCRFHKCSTTREPYGEGTAVRTYCECTAPDDNWCPYVRDVLEAALGIMTEAAP